MIEVYHLNDAVFIPKDKEDKDIDMRFLNVIMGMNTEDAAELFTQNYYILTARINTDDLETAWELTNHIDNNWKKNKFVRNLVDNPRSSKVGDIMKLQSGEYYVVSNIGFTKIVIDEINKSHKNKIK